MNVWHSRGYLPHFEAGAHPQFITFRLAGSLPAAVMQRWREELRCYQPDDAKQRLARCIEKYLDESHGERLLSDPVIAAMVENSLLHFDGQRYWLHGWVVMPNHVHLLATPTEGETLSKLLLSWKGYTAHQVNQYLGRRGSVWQSEYYDRAIRDGEHFDRALYYIHMNPVKANLCQSPEDWVYSSARRQLNQWDG